MNDTELSIVGEVADDETARKFIEMAAKVPKPMIPKMSLETYIDISRTIDEELNKFALKWYSKIDNLSYNEIFGLLQAEPDEYPVITKYNCIEKAKGSLDLLNGLYEALAGKTANEVEETWEQKKSTLWQFMIPNRYATEAKE